MLSRIKIILWLGRIFLFFILIFDVYCGYEFYFSLNSYKQAINTFTGTLFWGMIFFSTFPIMSLFTKTDNLKHQLSNNKSDFNLRFGAKSSNRKSVFYTLVAIIVCFVLFGIIKYVEIAFSKNNLKIFLACMIADIVVSFSFCTFILVSLINSCFNELKDVINKRI